MRGPLLALVLLSVIFGQGSSLYTDDIVNLFSEIGNSDTHGDPDGFHRGPPGPQEAQGVKTKLVHTTTTRKQLVWLIDRIDNIVSL